MTPKNWTGAIVNVNESREGKAEWRSDETSSLMACLVIEDLTSVRTVPEICRQHQLRAPVFPRWKTQLLKRVIEIFATEPCRGDQQQRIAELERVVARLTMDLEAARRPRTF